MVILEEESISSKAIVDSVPLVEPADISGTRQSAAASKRFIERVIKPAGQAEDSTVTDVYF